MKFIDQTQNIQIDLLDISCCQVRMTIYDHQRLAGIGRFLEHILRSAMLDGGESLNFTVELKKEEGDEYLLIQGNLISALRELCGVSKINDRIKEEMISKIVIETVSQANPFISPPGKSKFAIDVNQAILTNSPPVLRKGIIT